MNYLKRSFFSVMFLVAVECATALHITNCSSNRIQEISRAGMKSVIRYDETNAIELDKPVKNQNVSLWCESNAIVNRCILEHIKYEGTITKACEYETSSPCSNQDVHRCENKFISFEVSLENKCKFILNTLSIKGKLNQLIIIIIYKSFYIEVYLKYKFLMTRSFL